MSGNRQQDPPQDQPQAQYDVRDSFCFCDLGAAKIRVGAEYSLVPFYALAIMSRGVVWHAQPAMRLTESVSGWHLSRN
jgi:hypothetical protein